MKQEDEGNMITNWLEKYGNPEIMKQVEREAEELELQHYAKKYYNNFDKRKEEFAFLDGAKWQAERMYSEEDLHNAFYNGWIYRGENYTFPKAKKEWLEQFKNR